MYLITVRFNYGPFKTKRDAVIAKKKIKVSNATFGTITKRGSGYVFMGSLKYSANDAATKAKAVKLIKENAPSAKISVSKR
jgi:hypothetical protein